MTKILVTTSPFGQNNNARDMLVSAGIDIIENKWTREWEKEELLHNILDYQPIAIVAGTEVYDKEVLDKCENLKIISRVGIGLDSIDLEECKRRGIIVTYTPDAPSNAVAELTICHILNLLRRVQQVSIDMLNGRWNRYIGRELKNCKIGIIGFGRIGKLVYHKLISFNLKGVYINDIVRPNLFSKKEVLKACDVITLHIPLNEDTINFIDEEDFKLMGENKILINTSRGRIVNNDALYEWLQLDGTVAAVDVYENEPYKGKLTNCNNVILTPHLGSCTIQSRKDMEEGAVREVLNYFAGKEYNNRVI